MKLSLHLKIGLKNLKLAILSRRRPYKEFHREFMDYMADVDPKGAVGGRWEQMGKMQLDYLRKHGLHEGSRLLDLGCGSLRGGLPAIQFLQDGHYYGIDISSKLIEAGRGFVSQAGLTQKRPNLIVNDDLEFDELKGIRFDYIIAQSVFTHMPLDDIEQCFQNLHKIISAEGLFFATYHDGGRSTHRRGLFGERFYYPFSAFQALGEKYGYDVAVMNDYPSPTGQTMLRVKRITA